jgi:putative ABC transport system permease protein
MIKFLIKGLLRDKHRSLLQVIVVAAGVMLTVLFYCWITGVMGDSINFNAKFSTGHVKVMSRAYAENAQQIPNDLALLDAGSLMDELKEMFPEMKFVERIKFGGIIDVPGDNGETLTQGPAAGISADLLSPNTQEVSRLKLDKSLIRGQLPKRQGEVLLSDEFSQKLKVNPGDEISLISSTMYGSMSISNFIVSGTINFGTKQLDKGAIIMDLQDARMSFDMQDAVGEILGYFNTDYYSDELAKKVSVSFNEKYKDTDDEYAPVMLTLSEQGNFGDLLSYMEKMVGVLVFVFILAMSLVLWNAGLISGLRRYGEVGVRLAMGETNGHIYRSLIVESVSVGIAGTVLGTAIGLIFSWILQTHGISLGDSMNNASMMMPSTFYAQITPTAWFIGFFPGVISTVIGTMLSGVGIYKRKTAQLFKELET